MVGEVLDLVPIGAAMAVGFGTLAAGYAESSIGAAAMGAIAEDAKTFGPALLLTVIPESLAVFGLIIGLMLIFV